MEKRTKNILVCVAGATPQIITETIYALSVKKPPVYMDELYVITTAHGKKLIEKKLLTEKILSRLINEYNLPEIDLFPDRIFVIRDRKGNPLEDIRNSEDNEVTADLITTFIREMTEQQDTALHCSIAGGRKTMSYYLGSALQLFGRPQDRLYHVLVSPEFENNPEFFYPPKKPVKITCKLYDGTKKALSTSKARIDLAELPFVRLRDRVHIEGKTFREMIGEATDSIALSIDHSPLVINLKQRTVTVKDNTINLQPMLLCLYALFADQKINHCVQSDRKHCGECYDCYLKMADLMGWNFLKRMEVYYLKVFDNERSRLDNENWQEYEKNRGIPEKTVRQNISKIKSLIKKSFPNPELYIITSRGGYGVTRYGLRVDKRRIEIKA